MINHIKQSAIFLFLILLMVPIRSYAIVNVLGPVSFILDNEHLFTRNLHDCSFLSHTIVKQEDINIAFERNQALLAYIVYPGGPHCLVSDYPIENNPVTSVISSGRFASYAADVRNSLLLDGYEDATVELLRLDSAIGVSAYASKNGRAWSTHLLYYLVDDTVHVISFYFPDYEDVPVWRSYVIRFITHTIFNVELLNSPYESET